MRVPSGVSIAFRLQSLARSRFLAKDVSMPVLPDDVETIESSAGYPNAEHRIVETKSVKD